MRHRTLKSLTSLLCFSRTSNHNKLDLILSVSETSVRFLQSPDGGVLFREGLNVSQSSGSVQHLDPFSDRGSVPPPCRPQVPQQACSSRRGASVGALTVIFHFLRKLSLHFVAALISISRSVRKRDGRICVCIVRKKEMAAATRFSKICKLYLSKVIQLVSGYSVKSSKVHMKSNECRPRTQIHSRLQIYYNHTRRTTEHTHTLTHISNTNTTHSCTTQTEHSVSGFLLYSVHDILSQHLSYRVNST